MCTFITGVCLCSHRTMFIQMLKTDSFCVTFTRVPTRANSACQNIMNWRMNSLRWVHFFNLNSCIAACRPHPVKRPRLYLSPLVINFLFLFCFFLIGLNQVLNKHKSLIQNHNQIIEIHPTLLKHFTNIWPITTNEKNKSSSITERTSLHARHDKNKLKGSFMQLIKFE